MYRFIKFHCTLAVVALAFAQCTKDLTNDLFVGEVLNPSATKIINTSRSAVNGSLLVKFNETGTRAFECGTRSAGVTRSNIAPLNDILLDIDALSIERVFPIDIRHEAEARKAGLHHWYIVHFDEKYPLDKVALALAEIGEVETIQFRTSMASVEPVRSGNDASQQEGDSTTQLNSAHFNDPLAGYQWDLHNVGDKNFSKTAVAGMDVNVHEAWKYTTGDPSVIVAVVDQGVDYEHEDLVANMWVNKGEIPGDGIDNDNNGYIDDIHGVNFVDLVEKDGKYYGPITWDKQTDYIVVNNRKVYGDVGHGTHIAGTIAAVNNNGIGVSGIAGGDGTPDSGVKIMSVQIYSGRSNNNATPDVVAKAYQYAANNGAVLANNSWGSAPGAYKNDRDYTEYMGGIEYNAIQYFKNKSNHPNIEGGVVFFSSGNNYKSSVSYPGAYRDFIAVTSVGIDGYPAIYTNYGPGANIAAPGGNSSRGGLSSQILSTLTSGYPDAEYNGGEYGYMQGTSMACPHATGVAALGISYAKKIGKKLSADEFDTKFLLSVREIDNYMSLLPEEFGGYIRKMGTGRVDAFLFMMNIEGIGCIPVPRGQTNFQIDVNKYMADSNANIKLIDIEISEADMARLGMKNKPRYSSMYNTFYVTCTNSGSAIITVNMIAGGDTLGNSDAAGGKAISKRFALIVRDNFAQNGGWL